MNGVSLRCRDYDLRNRRKKGLRRAGDPQCRPVDKPAYAALNCIKRIFNKVNNPDRFNGTITALS
jgi:hypothetical protein